MEIIEAAAGPIAIVAAIAVLFVRACLSNTDYDRVRYDR